MYCCNRNNKGVYINLRVNNENQRQFILYSITTDADCEEAFLFTPKGVVAPLPLAPRRPPACPLSNSSRTVHKRPPWASTDVFALYACQVSIVVHTRGRGRGDNACTFHVFFLLYSSSRSSVRRPNGKSDWLRTCYRCMGLARRRRYQPDGRERRGRTISPTTTMRRVTDLGARRRDRGNNRRVVNKSK